MHYRFIEVEVTRPLVALEFGAGEAGAGLLVRRSGRPIGFFMRENKGKLTWPPEELSPWIASELKTKNCRGSNSR
jgi:hypothetical protein